MSTINFDKWKKNQLVKETTTKTYQLSKSPLAEINLYKNIDHDVLNAEILTLQDINTAIGFFKQNNTLELVLHYGHFFNANYSEVLKLTEYLIKHFTGQIIAFSPEEIIFLSIRANKSIEDTIKDLLRIGVTKSLGFLPNSIVNSKYYAEDDELIIEDRHYFLSYLISYGIKFNYPFNLSQVETYSDLESMLNFIKTNNITELVLQPNKSVEIESEINYEQGQLLLKSLDLDFLYPYSQSDKSSFFITQNAFNISTQFIV